MSALLVSVLVASVVGSLHCAGMCGGFVVFYAGVDASQGRRQFLSHLAYNGGRLLSYATLGLLAGGVGAGIDLAGSAANLQRLAGLLAGGLMLVWAAATLLPLLGIKLGGGKPSRLGQLLSRSLSRLRCRPPILRALALGGLTVLLPCGWLYAFVISAAGTGSAWRGLLVMVAFWLGTVPTLLGLGLGAQRISRSLGRYLPLVTAALLLAVGVVALSGRLSLPPAALPGKVRHPVGVEAVRRSIDRPRVLEDPCCGN